MACNKKPDQHKTLYEELSLVCDSIINNTHVPGLVAAVWAPDKDISFVYAAGVINVHSGQIMDASFHFRIGSNTKTGFPEFSEKYDISWAQAAGSMVSTVNDLKKYVEALNSGFFLSDSLQQIRMAKKI